MLEFFHKLKKAVRLFLLGFDSPWWDYSGLLRLMEFQLEDMDRNWHKCAHNYSLKKHRRVKEAKLLCKRLRENNYIEPKNLGFHTYKESRIISGSTFSYCTIEDELAQADLDRLTYLLNRYMFGWWD